MIVPICKSLPFKAHSRVIVSKDFVLSEGHFASRKQTSFIRPGLEITSVVQKETGKTKVTIMINDGSKSAPSVVFRTSCFEAILDPKTHKVETLSLKRTWDDYDWELAHICECPLTNVTVCSEEDISTDKKRLLKIYESVVGHFDKNPIKESDIKREYLAKQLETFKLIIDSINS